MPPEVPPVEGATGAPPIVPPVPPPVTTPPVAAKTPTTTPPAEPKRVRLTADGDDIPEDAELIEMTRGALASRLARASNKDLLKRFGTNDADKITADLKELEALKAEKEAARIEKLSEIDKANERVTTAERERDTAQAQAREAHTMRTYDRDERRLTRAAEKVVDPDYVDAELVRFAKHLRQTYDSKTLRKMTPVQESQILNEFLTERVKLKPKIGKDYETQKAEEIRAQLKADLKAGRKAPVTNGGGGGRPDKTEPVDDDAVLGKQDYSKIKAAGFSYK